MCLLMHCDVYADALRWKISWRLQLNPQTVDRLQTARNSYTVDTEHISANRTELLRFWPGVPLWNDCAEMIYRNLKCQYIYYTSDSKFTESYETMTS